jgi:hypothetical protein
MFNNIPRGLDEVLHRITTASQRSDALRYKIKKFGLIFSLPTPTEKS